MKVAFVLMHPFSDSMGSIVRVRELALGLQKDGVEAYIFTPYERTFDLSSNVHVISLNSLINRLGISNKIYKFSKKLYYNQSFAQIFSKVDSKSNIIIANFVNNLAKLVRDYDIDIVQVEQDAAIPIAVGLKEKTNIPIVLDIHNISSEELVSVGLLKNPSKEYSTLQNITKRGLSKLDHVIVVSECMKDYVITNYGLCEEYVSVVPPGGRLTLKRPNTGKGGPSRVVYAGLVASREHVDLFVRSIPIVLRRQPETEFYITNKGENVSKVKELAQALGVHINYFWFEDFRELDSFLSSCDVGVLPSSSDLARRMGTPAKLFNYLSVGLPIVANDIGGWANIVEHFEVGLLTSADPEAFGNAIVRLIEDKELKEKLVLNGQRLIATKFNWGSSAEALLGVYKEIIR